jgi:uncharacterized delta-60 repeat protein
MTPVVLLVLAGFAAPFAGTAQASPGVLDPNFGVGGLVLTSIGDGNSQADAVAPTSDGGMVAAGPAVVAGALEFALARYTADGTLNTSFGSNGVVTANLGTTTSRVDAIAVEPSGDILVAGSADTASSSTDVLLALYSATGQLVNGFGSGGSESVAIGDGGDAQANAVVLDGGNVLVAGRAVNGGHYVEFFASFSDSSGAENGTPYFGDFGNQTDTEANAIALDGSDVLLAGFTAAAVGYHEALVTELDASGSAQTGFGNNGAAALNFGLDAEANAVVVQSGGGIVVGGAAATSQGVNEVMLAGLTSSGAINTSFGSSGVNALAIGSGGSAAGNALAIDSSGNLLVAGQAADSDGGEPATLPLVARFTSAGQLDTSFAPSSATPGAELLTCNTDATFNAGYVDGSGNFVVAGGTGADSTNQAFLLARYTDSSTAGSGCSPGSGGGGGGSGGGGGGGGSGGGHGGSGGSGGSGGGGSTGTGSGGCVQKQMTFGILVVRACFVRLGTRYLASGSISLDGLSIDPSPCTSLQFDTVADTIESECDQGGSGEVAISAPTRGGVISGIPLYRGSVDWTIPTADGDDLGELDIGSFAEIEGFPLVGQVDPVAMSGGALQLPLSVSLPSPFDSVTGSVSLQTQIGQALSLGALEIDVPEVWLGPLDIQSFDVSYDASTDTWSAQAQASFASPLDYGVGAGVAFQNDSLTGLSYDFDFGTPGVPLGDEGLFLNDLGFGVYTDPLKITGSLGLSVADVFGLKGELTVEIPKGGWDIRIDGNLSVGGIGLASGYVEIDSDGNAFFGGGLNYGSCDFACFQADADGWIDLSQASFDAEVSAQAQILGFSLGGATINVSSKSIAVCGSVNYEFVTFSLGGAYVYGQGFSIMGGADILGIKIGNGGDCDLSGYVLTPPTPVIGSGSGSGSGAAKDSGDGRFAGLAERPDAATPADELTVKPKTRGLSWQLQGVGAPPQVTISGPGGVSVSTSSDGSPVKTSNALILQDPKSDVTYVILAEPKAGRWIITPQGTSTITSISTAEILPPPHVTASVRGTGLARVLRYAITPIPGQSVRFLEHEGTFTHVIATVTNDRGAIHFTPADGPTGRRTILAQVLQGISVRKQLDVGSYVTPPDLGPQKPVHLNAIHKGGSLGVSWRRGSGDQLYLVQVRATSGATTVVQTKATSAAVRLSAVAGATVTVTPRTLTAEEGPSATVKVPAPVAPKLRRLPQIHGTARVGNTVSCELGSWTNRPTRYVVEWLSNGVTLAGADHRTFRLAAAETSKEITCTVTARNAAGFAVATSHKVRVPSLHKPRKGKGKSHTKKSPK